MEKRIIFSEKGDKRTMANGIGTELEDIQLRLLLLIVVGTIGLQDWGSVR